VADPAVKLHVGVAADDYWGVESFEDRLKAVLSGVNLVKMSFSF
jgi:hypothetical protein